MSRYWLRCIFACVCCWISRCKKLGNNCPVQPNDLITAYDAMGVTPACIIEFNTKSLFSSTVLVEESLAVPQSQAWSRCLNCIWMKRRGVHDGSVDISGYHGNENISHASKNNLEFFAFSPTLKSDSIYLNREYSSFRDKGFEMALPHSEYVSDIIDLSWSLWGEFFHHDMSDQYRVRINPPIPGMTLKYRPPMPKYIVRSPTFIVPIITFHVGHVLIDVLQQIYTTMIKDYGCVRKDSLIIFDVAALDEKSVLLKKLIYNLYNKTKDTYGAMLLAISDVPMVTTNILKDEWFFDRNAFHCSGVTCDHFSDAIIFTDLHIGLNIESSYFYYGYQYNSLDFMEHKCSVQKSLESGYSSSLFIETLSRNYGNFQRYILSFLHKNDDLLNSLVEVEDADRRLLSHYPLLTPKNALIIHRHDNRVILNLEDVLLGDGHNFDDFQCSRCDEIGGIVEHFSRNRRNSSGIPFEVYNLQYTPFRMQTELFANTRILVATAGTSLHNMIFMPPYSAVIIIMQHSSWCPWAWMYSNQAFLLKIYPLIYCPGSSSEQHFHWTRAFWLQAPRTNKLDNVTVDFKQFNALYRKAVALTECGAKCFFTNATYEEKVCSMERGIHSSPMKTDSANISNSLDGDKNLKLMEVMNENGLKLRVSSVKVKSLCTVPDCRQQSLWELSMSGVILSDHSSQHYLFASFPHLTICIHSMLLDDSDDHVEDSHFGISRAVLVDEFGNLSTLEGSSFLKFHHRQYAPKFDYSSTRKYHQDSWCYPVEMFNYYADLKLTMSSPVHHLHLWLQSSKYGGKIKGSDAYLILDLETPTYTLKHDVPVVDSLVAVTSPQLQAILREEFLVKCPVRLRLHPLYIDVLFNQCSCPGHNIVSECLDNACSSAGSIVCNCRKVQFEMFIDERMCTNDKLPSSYFLDDYLIEFCRSNDFQSHRQCMELYVLVYQKVLTVLRLDKHALDGHMPNMLLLPANNYRQIAPTPSEPFTFLHIEKSAGTTLREYIYESAVNLYNSNPTAGVTVNNTMIIPCHGNVHCINFMLHKYGLRLQPREQADHASEYTRFSTFEHVSVIAGHFSWHVWNELPQRSQSKDTPPCLVVGRHPVSRFISYYYQRCYNSPSCPGYRTPLNEMSPESLKGYIDTTRQLVPLDDEWKSQAIDNWDKDRSFPLYALLDDGLSDAACRTMLRRSFEDESETDTLRVRSGKGVVLDSNGIFDEMDQNAVREEVHSIRYDAPPPLTYEQMSGALQNVESCVVGLVEEWESSKTIVNFYFPWLKFDAEPNKRKMKLYANIETLDELRSDIYDTVVDANVCDMALYHKMRNMFASEQILVNNGVFDANMN